MLFRSLKSRGAREKVILSTKGGHPSAYDKKTIRLAKEEVAADLEESLRNLGVDCVDIYWLHRDDPSRDVSYIIDYLDEFVKEGKIKFPAVSNWSAKRIAEANAYAAKAGKTPIAMSQIQWSLASTTMFLLILHISDSGLIDDTFVFLNIVVFTH